MELGLRIQHDDHQAVVHVSGEVDLATCSQLRDALTEAIERGARHLVVDLGQVSFMDSSGVGVLIGVHRRISERNGSIQLAAPRPPVLRVLEVTGVTALLSLSDQTSEV